MKRKDTNQNKKSKNKKQSKKHLKEEESKETINKHCPKKDNIKGQKKTRINRKRNK